MPRDADVWRALLRSKGLTVSEFAERLGTTRQHAHRILAGARSADARREELDRALALGDDDESGDQPLFAIAHLAHGELDLIPAGDTQPLFADRELATSVATSLETRDSGVCVVPVWPEYAWRHLVSFHAAWGSEAEPRGIFVVDNLSVGLPLVSLLAELQEGFAETLRLRAAGDDPPRLREVIARLRSTR
jgi:transcriptional regulator with XRE-family HTH domain